MRWLRRRRAALIWIAYAGAFVLFVRLRSLAGRTGIPVRYRYPIRLDQLLLGGHHPTLYLQHLFDQPDRVTLFDAFLVVIYVSYFFVPHLLAVILWRRSRGRFTRYSLALYGTLYLGLLLNFLIPTAPPWLAARHGYLPEFPRLVPRAIDAIIPNIFATGDRIGGKNDVAAMPSLHLAITAVAGLTLTAWGRIGALLGALYIALMGFALVYLGEHYLSDVLAGLLLASAVWSLAWHMTVPRRSRRRAAGSGC